MGSRPVLGHVSFATGSFCRSSTCRDVTSLIPLELTVRWGILRGARKDTVPVCRAVPPPLPRKVSGV